MRPCLVKVAGPHGAAVGVADAAEANAEGVESKPLVMAAVVKPIMMMSVEYLAHAKAAGQLVDGIEAVRVRAGGLMRHQDVGALPDQAEVVGWED